MGVIISAHKNLSNISNHFVPGIQSVGFDLQSNQYQVFEQAGVQSFLDDYDFPYTSITIDRVISDIDKLWLEKSSSNLWDHTNFTSSEQYKNSFLLKKENFGLSINSLSNRSLVQNSILPEFDILAIYKDMNSSVIGVSGLSGTALDIIEMPKCLLSNISYSFSNTGVFTESVGFTGRETIKKTSNDYSFDTRGGSELASSSSFVNLLGRQHFSYPLSVLPQSLLSCVDFNEYLDGSKILGISNIDLSIDFEYSKITNSIWETGDRVNEFTQLNLPVAINCSFSVLARRSLQFSVLNKNNNFQNERICIVLKTKNPYGPGFKFFIFNLGNKNRLVSIEETDGSTDGSIVNYTFNYSNYKNDFVTYTQIQESEEALNPPLFQQTTESY